jgi:3-hydroxyacyl-[acyl-carrier-protein] dehydratase
MNSQELKNYIPHREPMLLVNNVELGSDGMSHGVYEVKGDEWFLQGHFPDMPIVPGVIQCEMLAQSSCMLLLENIKGRTPMFGGLDNIRFKKPVRPGDKIELICKLKKVRDPFYFVSGKGMVDGQICVSGEFFFVLV